MLLADLVAERLITVERKRAPDLWKRLLQGTPSAEELLELATRAGLREVHAVTCYDCLRDAPIAEAGRGTPRVHSLTLFATFSRGSAAAAARSSSGLT